MYKTNMTAVPAKVHSDVCTLLQRDGRELIHIAYESMLQGDDATFILIAREEEPVNEMCYSVHSYNSDENKLFRGTYSLTYPEALVVMGNVLKE